MTDISSSPQAERLPRRVRHDLRFRRLTVIRSVRRTPSLIQVTVGGPDLAGFASPGFDDHVKLFFPDEQTGQLSLPTLDAEGRIAWSDGPRPVARDYTPLAYDAAAQTLDIAFALHEAGPATRWAQNARPGDVLGVGGPRGSFILPTNFDGYVLIGDDTALPAIERRLAELPAGAPVRVLVEVDDAASQLDWVDRPGTTVQWVHRQGDGRLPSQGLGQAAAQLAWPVGGVHVWIAAESGVAKALRAQVIAERGQNPKWIKAAGYWRAGAAGAHDEHND
ncbi:MAG: NADPH-dependent ferric-chelate reductase [Paracidovorax wautersii]|uniref:NADPH-dependent ferric-chelate reductase n=1 Tax=Paracidovorax wautersii TaxID=1177982 RepID=A0A7V8JRI9_9BURK|nr:MAG: NADPH-dependent ferric-chelate reductase [Paracidovorax wautersii]